MTSHFLKSCYRDQTAWEDALSAFLFSFRVAPGQTSGYSPHFLNTGRQVRLPIDTFLEPKRVYYGDNPIELNLRNLHFAFHVVRERTYQVRKNVRDKINAKISNCAIDVNDKVYFLNKSQAPDVSKIKNKWEPFWIVIQKVNETTFVISNEFTGDVKTCHRDKLKLSLHDDWDSMNLETPLIFNRDSENENSSSTRRQSLRSRNRILSVIEE